MADFKIKNGETVRTVKCAKASATVIEAGDLVTLSSGLIIKAVAGSAKIAFAPNGAGDGETEIDVTIGSDFTLVGTGDAVYDAVTMVGTEVDLVGTTNLLIDVGASSTDVFIMGISTSSGTEDATTNMEVRINPVKVLF